MSMQTYTHFLFAVATAPYISENPLVGVAWIAGNIFPDGTVATQFVLDKLTGKAPLVVEPPAWVIIKNFCHSLVLAAVIMLAGRDHQWILMFGAGMALHVMIDIVTHSSEDSNCIYAYPFPLKSYCLWEYRIGDGILRPKKPELIICILCMIVVLINITLFIVMRW